MASNLFGGMMVLLGLLVVSCSSSRIEAIQTADLDSYRQRLFVVRHGERIDKVAPSWGMAATRPQDPPLTERGWEQARTLGHHLKFAHPFKTLIVDENPENKIIFFSSPMMRCVQTAQGIAEGLGLKDAGIPFSIVIEDSLVEGSHWVNLCLNNSQQVLQEGTHLPLWNDATHHKKRTSPFVASTVQDLIDAGYAMGDSETCEDGEASERKRNRGAELLKGSGWYPPQVKDDDGSGLMAELEDTYTRCDKAADALFGKHSVAAAAARDGKNKLSPAHIAALNTPVLFFIGHGETTSAWSTGLAKEQVPDIASYTGFAEFLIGKERREGKDGTNMLPLDYYGELLSTPHL